MSKLSVIFNGSCIIGLGGIFGRGEVSQMNPFTPNDNFCSPFFRNFENSYKSCGVIASHSCIAMVLGIRALAQIGAAIIKSVVVYVVYLLSFYAGKNLSSHNDASSLVWYVDIPNGIKAVRVYVPLRKPVKLREPFKIRSIYDGILSLCERNKTVGCIKRLVNCVTFHAVSWHRSTSNRLVQTSRKYITASVFSILFLAPCAFSQSTTVSGTIADSNGQAFAFGSFKVEFFSNGLPTPFYWNGAPFDISTHFSGLLDGTGSFAGVVVPSSNFITPVGTAWRFTVCSAATTSQCYAQIVTVTGVTLNVTGLIVPVPIVVNANQFSQPAAYTDGEIAGPILGFTYYPINTNCLRVYAGGFPPNWVNICGGGGTGCTLAGTDTGVVSEHPVGVCYDSPRFTWDDGAFKQNLQAGGSNTIGSGNSDTFILGPTNTANSSGGATPTEVSIVGDNNTITPNTNDSEFYVFGENNSMVRTHGDNYVLGNNATMQDIGQNVIAIGSGQIAESATPGTASNIADCYMFGENTTLSLTPGGHTLEGCAVVGFGNQIFDSGTNSVSNVFLSGESNVLDSTTGNGISQVHIMGAANTVEDTNNQSNQVEIVGENNDVNGSLSTVQILGFKNSAVNVSVQGINTVNTVLVGSANTATHTGASGINAYQELFGHQISLSNCRNCLAIGSNVSVSSDNTMGIGMSASPEIVITAGNVKIAGGAQSAPVAFSALPACAGGTEGSMRAITDSTTNTWGATISGSGTNHVLAYCDGTNWTVMGK